MLNQIWMVLQPMFISIVTAVLTVLVTDKVKARMERSRKLKADSEQYLERFHMLASRYVALIMDMKKSCDDAYWSSNPEVREEALERLVRQFQDEIVSEFRLLSLSKDELQPKIVETARQIVSEFGHCDSLLANLPSKLGSRVYIFEGFGPKPEPDEEWYLETVTRPLFDLTKKLRKFILDVERSR